VFDHTSLIRFIERRFGPRDTTLFEPNITTWRRPASRPHSGGADDAGAGVAGSGCASGPRGAVSPERVGLGRYQRLSGHIETGRDSVSDPTLGGIGAVP
jgi:hypothetical protein